MKTSLISQWVFSIRRASQVKSLKWQCVSDLENTTTATYSAILISWKAQGNTSHVIIMSIVWCGPGRLCWLACVGGDKEERFSHWWTHAWKYLMVEAHRDIKGMCMYTKKRVSAHTHSRTHTQWRVLSLVGHTVRRNMHRPWRFHGFHCMCAVWRINYTHLSRHGGICRDRHPVTCSLTCRLLFTHPPPVVFSVKVIFLNESVEGAVRPCHRCEYEEGEFVITGL